jgi:hypothetical protein
LKIHNFGRNCDMTKAKPKLRHLTLDPNPQGKSKRLGGADYDDWNDWLVSVVASALPVNQEDDAAASRAATAVFSGIINIGPADPIEGILVSQLMAANQASLSMYQRAWAQPSEYFEARTKYLALADKAARTVALLTERLDHHRGRGQQKIVVQHVTTNNVTADQAVITDSIVTGDAAHNAALSPALLAASGETPMPTLDETREPRLVGVGGGDENK